jgi:hypothetical protein
MDLGFLGWNLRGICLYLSFDERINLEDSEKESVFGIVSVFCF